MKRRILIGIVGILTSIFTSSQSPAAVDLVGHPFGARGRGAAAGGVHLINNDCGDCIFDGDLDTAWELKGTSLFTVDGHMTADANRTFWRPANVDTLSLRVLVDAENAAGSGRLNQGEFQFQYRVAGSGFETLLSDSFGPIGGEAPVAISFNDTLTDLGLKNVAEIRLLASAATSEGSGDSTLRIYMFHMGATGTFVPEPPSSALMTLALVFALGPRRTPQSRR